MFISLLKIKADLPQREDIIDLLDNMVNICNEGFREILTSLHNTYLEKHGLIKTIEKDVQNIFGTISIKLENNIENMRFPQNIEVNYYYIFRELVSNAIKHSCTSKVTVILKYANQTLSMNICDYGCGLKQSNKSERGLINLQNRVKQINGKYFIRSKDGCGTRIIVRTKMTTF
jgi:signal transduction histidine kinase